MSENNNQTAEQAAEEYSEQVRRREKLAQMKEAGSDPFELTVYDVTASAEEIRANFETLEGQTVRIAGG